MSYCRWSSNDYQCDIYCYETESGFVTHVASNRVVLGELPPPVDLPIGFTDAQFKTWEDRRKVVNSMIERAHHKAIGLPHDGETFEHDEPGECADNLVRLRDLGYVVPQGAIDALRAESADAPV